MKKILIISPKQGQDGGAQIVLDELLRSWTSKTITPVVLCPAHSRIHQTASAKGFQAVFFNGSLSLRNNLREIRQINKNIPPVHAVYAWTVRVFPAALWIAGKRGIPVAGTLHDSPLPAAIRGPVLWNFRQQDFCNWKGVLWNSREFLLKTWWRWQWAHRSANRFEKLICVSDAVRRACVKKGYRCPLSVIRNGLSDLPVPERVPQNEVRIGFLGTGQPQRKGFSLIEQWIPMFGAKSVIWKLYGNASENTLRRIERLRSSTVENKKSDAMPHAPCAKPLPYIDYRGFQDRDTIFSEIDLLVHTSNLFDPLPTVLIEAARAGIPCIASSNGGGGEIVEDGISGFVFDSKKPEEGLEKLEQLCNPAVREQMGLAARTIFEQRFRVERMVREYEETFMHLVEPAEDLS